ncbi:MAG: DUF4388 domain-containing protein [Roseiflexaceae bacterium]|nr:DUF4388 domain-containing protein [Roseiflexaceae bacterium]
MALVGNIRDFGLSDFLYLVDRGYKTGCLHLTRGGDTASLYFDKGKLVTATRNNIAAPVADLLIAKGKLTPQQSQHAIQAQRSNGGTHIGQVLIQLNYISRDDLQQLLQQHIEESVYTLFGWPEGDFRFEQNQRPETEALVMPTPLAVEHLIMEGVRRIDEWGRIKDRIPSTDMIVRFVEQPGEKAKGINLAAEEWRIFARINGKDTLSEIAQKTNMSDFDVCRIVYGFLTAGLVDVLKKPRPIPIDAAGRPIQEAPRVKKSLVSRIINRIRGM